MKHMILLFKMKGDLISDHFLMLWFQKGSLDTVGFSTFKTLGRGRGSGSPKLDCGFWWTKVTFDSLHQLQKGYTIFSNLEKLFTPLRNCYDINRHQVYSRSQ